MNTWLCSVMIVALTGAAALPDAFAATKVPHHSAAPATAASAKGEDASADDSTGSLPPPEENEATEPPAPATTPSGKFPRFASLKKTEVNVRSGPGNQYPILWIYQRAGYPVQLLTRYDNYYKIRDVEGEEGWAYIGMISAKLTGLVGGKQPALLHKHEAQDSPVVARLAPGVIVEMIECTDATPSVCKVETAGYKGWLPKKSLEMVE